MSHPLNVINRFEKQIAVSQNKTLLITPRVIFAKWIQKLYIQSHDETINYSNIENSKYIRVTNAKANN